MLLECPTSQVRPTRSLNREEKAFTALEWRQSECCLYRVDKAHSLCILLLITWWCLFQVGKIYQAADPSPLTPPILFMETWWQLSVITSLSFLHLMISQPQELFPIWTSYLLGWGWARAGAVIDITAQLAKCLAEGQQHTPWTYSPFMTAENVSRYCTCPWIGSNSRNYAAKTLCSPNSQRTPVV